MSKYIWGGVRNSKCCDGRKTKKEMRNSYIIYNTSNKGKKLSFKEVVKFSDRSSIAE